QIAEAPAQSLEQSFPLLESATSTAGSQPSAMGMQSGAMTGGGGFDPNAGHPGVLDSSSPTGFEQPNYGQQGYGADPSGMMSSMAPTDPPMGGDPMMSSHPSIENVRDDLTIIEGVGPQIAELFYSYGINKFADLASTDPSQLRQIMATDFAAHDPSTWPDQAQMAAIGDWDGLKAWQDQLQGGREVAPQDDLTLIEGIGPKIAEILTMNGLRTFSDLAMRQPMEISAILGPEFASHDPSTWAQQAQLAATGQWDQLRAWQDELDGGRVVSGAGADDLTIIEGIGPAIAEILNAAGIVSWTQLASTSIEQIQEVMAHAGGQYSVHDPATWPQQAQMAADGLFDELRAWQEKLDGGRM
ncbi:MAG: helix-hairpin-helix domain-containing protein, partial [Planctomycetota bacterium]